MSTRGLLCRKGVPGGLLLTVAAVLAVSACSLGASPKLSITVTNNTSEEVTVRLNGGIAKPLAPGTTERVPELGSRSACLQAGVTATTGEPVAPDWSAPVGALEATMPTPICDGDEWVIEESDLVPMEGVGPGRTPSPAESEGDS